MQTPYEVFELTAREVAQLDGDLIHRYMRRHEFRLASMNSRDREKMFETMIEEEGIKSGWFYWYCCPGCLPDSDPFGPYPTREAAQKAAQEDIEEQGA